MEVTNLEKGGHKHANDTQLGIDPVYFFVEVAECQQRIELASSDFCYPNYHCFEPVPQCSSVGRSNH